MKLFAFADIHGSLKALKIISTRIKKFNPDVVVCAGDLTIFEKNADKLLQYVNMLKKPVLLIHGNHERAAHLKRLSLNFKNICFVHKQMVNIKGVLFIGWGGGGFSYKDRNFERWIASKRDTIRRSSKIIFLTHAPVFGTKTDLVNQQHCGNKSFRRFVLRNTAKIKAVISGHIHETAGVVDRIGTTTIVNPGLFGIAIKF